MDKGCTSQLCVVLFPKIKRVGSNLPQNCQCFLFLCCLFAPSGMGVTLNSFYSFCYRSAAASQEKGGAFPYLQASVIRNEPKFRLHNYSGWPAAPVPVGAPANYVLICSRKLKRVGSRFPQN